MFRYAFIWSNAQNVEFSELIELLYVILEICVKLNKLIKLLSIKDFCDLFSRSLKFLSETTFFPETTELFKAKFHVAPPLVWGTKLRSN